MSEEKKELIESISPGTLKIGEIHPAAHSAMNYINEFVSNHIHETMILLESFAATAHAGNRLSEACHETLRRVISGEPISDRYLLGLAWTIKEMYDEPVKKNKKTKKSKH